MPALGAEMPQQAAVAHYRIDPAMSQFTVRVFASGLLSSLGHNPTIGIREYSGEVDFVGDNLEQASLRLRVHADSFEVTDDVSDKDRRDIEERMKQDVLETSRYREIVFESSSISATKMGEGFFAANISGNLTLHGATCRQTIIARVVLNGDSLRASGELSVRQTDFGIKLVSVAGGTLKVKDELKVSFDTVARKEE
jgi:polyisoprenoid-binding protein YceI